MWVALLPPLSISVSIESIPKIFGVGLVQHWKEIFFYFRIFCQPPETPLGAEISASEDQNDPKSSREIWHKVT